MKEYWIETSPISFLSIYDLHISMEVNGHGTAIIKGYIEEDREEEYAQMLNGEVWISIVTADAQENRETIFCGCVTGYLFTLKNAHKAAEIELKSGTYLMDIDTHTRFFQDTSVTYGDICGQIRSQNGGQGTEKAPEAGCPVNALVVQYEETDWEFITRLLSNCGSYLVPESRGQGIFYTVGMPEGRERQTGEGVYFYLEKDLQEFREKKANGLENISETDCIVCHIQMREVCSLGDFFRIDGRMMYIYEAELNYEQGEIIGSYKAKTRNGIKTVKKTAEKISGVSLEAVVREVKQDKVRLEIKKDENEGGCQKKWFAVSTPYSSVDGTGWYCMPERGDLVRLQFPDALEDNAYVISAVHLQSGDRSNPDHKIFKNRQQKEIRFTPDSILITNNRGMKIEMSDGNGIQIESDKSILIKADQDVNVISGSASLMLAADTSLVLNQGGTSIQLEDGIRFMGGEFHVQ